MRGYCSFCGAWISVQKNRAERSDHSFCSGECKKRFYSQDGRVKGERIKLILAYLETNNEASRREIGESLGINRNTLNNYLRELKEEDKIKMLRPEHDKTRIVYRLVGGNGE